MALTIQTRAVNGGDGALMVSEATIQRLAEWAAPFASFEATLIAMMDRLEQMEAGVATKVMPGLMHHGLAAAGLITVPKVASQLDLTEAILATLAAAGGTAQIREIVAGVAERLPEASKHKNFRQHVSWAASSLRQAGKLLNGKDHHVWGEWRLVTPEPQA